MFFNNVDTDSANDGLENSPPIPRSLVQPLPSGPFQMESFGAGEPDLRLAGDFYNVPESITRGVALVEPGMLELHHPGEDDAFLPSFDLPHLSPPAFHKAEQIEVLFPEDVLAAEVPLHGSSSPCVQLHGVGAAQAASCVYDFLNTKASASIFKVRPQKFAMKATVFHEQRAFVSCVLKARVFSASSGLVVEFRRCSGDALAFAHVFEQASNHLRLSFSMPPAAAPLLPAPAAIPGEASEVLIQPLVEMIAGGHAAAEDPFQAEHGRTAVQPEAEAVAALAALVSAHTAGLLASLDVKVLEELCGRAVETAYPAAKLAANLVSAAEPRLTIELTLAALRGAAADDLDGLVRLELAEAVRAVAQKCAAPETSMDRSALQRALQEACAEQTYRDGAVSRCLRDALGTLEATEHLQDGVMA